MADDPEAEPAEPPFNVEFKVIKGLSEGTPQTWPEPRWWDRANWLRWNRETGQWERWGDPSADEGEGG